MSIFEISFSFTIIPSGKIIQSLQEVIKQLGVPLLGWIANRINPCLGYYKEVIEILEAQIDAPLLGKIPYIHKQESQGLGNYLTNIDRLMYMQTELVK